MYIQLCDKCLSQNVCSHPAGLKEILRFRSRRVFTLPAKDYYWADFGPLQFNLYIHIIFRKNHFNIILQIMLRSPMFVLLFYSMLFLTQLSKA
jgi:hypothetical protein